MEDSICITALIITYARPSWLARCIESLVEAAKKAHGVDLKIVIWVNGLDESTTNAIRKIKENHGTFISAVAECPDRLTPAKARNRALELISPQDQWVLFIDDDAYVPEDFFLNFIEVRSAFAAACAIGGPNLTPPSSSVFQHATGITLSSRLATYSSFSRYQKAGSLRECEEDSLILCNLFVKRQALGPNPFPEDFVCSEENWLLQSLKFKNQSLVYSPSLYVFHERRPGPRQFTAQVFQYGFGRAQNIWNRPMTFKLVHVLPSVCVLYALYALSFLLLGLQMPKMWVPLLSLYVLLCLCATFARVQFSRKGLPAIAISLLLFPVLHVSYGLGVLCGLIAAHDRTSN